MRLCKTQDFDKLSPNGVEYISAETTYFSKSAIDSTCAVCGNMSITPARSMR